MLAEPALSPASPDLADLLALVAHGERVVIVDSAGRPAAAVVPLSTLAELEALRARVEDLEDILAADAAMAEPGDAVPWEQVKAELQAEWDAEERAAA